MAILKSTQIKGDLTVTGSLNVQGNLTYVGVENLRVKDKQIELNTDAEGTAASAGANADEAGIVIRGARKSENVIDDASILYDYADDTLVVNKTIKGTVSNATTAASADKVANKLTVNVTDETGSVKTVEFDGSEVKTVDVNLKGLQDQINSLTGGAGSIATQINDAIAALDSEVEATTVGGTAQKGGVLVLQGVTIREVDGKLSQDTSEVSIAEVEQAGAAAAVKTELIGKDSDTETSNTIVGAKKYADSLAGNYAAASHTHEISDVNGLQGALDGKAAADHTHTNYDAHLADTVKHITAEERTAWNGKQDALSEAQLAAVNSGITKAKVDNYEAHVANTNIHVTADDKAKWNAAEQNAIDHADSLNTAMDTRVKVLEAIDHNQLAKDASADAVAKVVAGAPESFDTLKEVADWIKNDKTGAAALQTDVAGLKTDVAGLKTDVSTLESASHTHANKAELDKIVDGDKAKWDNHVADADIHVTAEQKTAWSRKQDALANADVLKAITGTQVTNWDNAATKAHVHGNKTVLDGITAEEVAAWNSAANAAVVNSVGGKSGALTLKGGSETLGDVNLSISDTGEISAAIVPNSFDAKGAAGTALTDANAYTDGKVADLKTIVDSLSKDALKGVAAGTYVSVSTKSNNSQTISVTTKKVADASDSANGLALAADVKKYVDDKNALQDANITNIQNSYVQKAGDTMTGNLTMPSNGTNGIVFGNMKIVWNSTDNAIEFVATA